MRSKQNTLFKKSSIKASKKESIQNGKRLKKKDLKTRKKANKKINIQTGVQIINEAQLVNNKKIKTNNKLILDSKLIGWNPLEKGSIVDVVAPASRGPDDELNAGIKILESWGLQVRIENSLFGDNILHSNSDAKRWEYFSKALRSPDSSALWCVRGGYGSMKLLPHLAKLKKPRQSKIFLGLSDLASLNVFFNQNWHWPTLHAPILTRIGKGDLPNESVEELKQILFGHKNELTYPLIPFNEAAKKVKKIQAPLMGGNWVTLMAGVGTPYQLQPQGQIVFIEEVAERAYRLDRQWEQWKQMGFLDKISAIVLGDFILGDEPDGKNYVWDILKQRAQEWNKPVFKGIPSGHGLIQRTLPLGVIACIQNMASKSIAGTKVIPQNSDKDLETGFCLVTPTGAHL